MMETGWHHQPLAEAVDRVGRGVLMMALGIGWFTWLWGLNLPSLLAGSALGVLLLLLRRLYRQMTLTRREAALRCRIGGELLMEQMLLMEAQEAHCQAAELLSLRWPLHLHQATADGVICRQNSELLLVQCVRLPAQGELGMGHLLDAYRAMKRNRADRVVLCVMGKTPPRVASEAEQFPVPIRLVRREVLLTLAGRHCPATNEQLVELGQRKRRVKQRGSLLRIMTQREKARRYWGYGLFLLELYVLSGSAWYAMPGVVCLTLAVVCRSGRAEEERL